MNRFFIFAVVVGLVLVGVGAGIGHLIMGDSWSPRVYVPISPNDCYVAPHGDPLYDAHYAKEVNAHNCAAIVDRADARLIEAQAAAIREETKRENLAQQATALAFAVVAVVIAFIIAVIIREGS